MKVSENLSDKILCLPISDEIKQKSKIYMQYFK